MPKLTKEAWLSQLEECGTQLTNKDVIKMVFADGPNALWDEVVHQKHITTDGMYAYFADRFPVRVWNDWQGIDEFSRTYHDRICHWISVCLLAPCRFVTRMTPTNAALIIAAFLPVVSVTSHR